MKGKGFLSGLPFERRTGNLDARDGPLFLRLAPQGKDDRSSAQHFFPSFPRESVLEFDITKNGLRFGHVIEDHLVTFAVSLNDHLLEFLAGRDIFGML